MSDSIIQARPDKVKVSLMAGAQYCDNELGLNPVEVMHEARALGKQPGKISPHDYFYYRLFDPELSEASRARFVGGRLERTLHKLTFDRDAAPLATDKCVFETTLRQAGFPTPETLCLFQGKPKGTPDGGWDTVTDATALTAWLEAGQDYPLYAKPRQGIRSGGVLALDQLDPADGAVTLGDGSRHPLAAVVDAVGQYRRKGYLIQRRLHPHPDLAAVVGDVIATVRVVILAGDREPTIHRAAWKLPVGASVADNFWRGNILAGLDPATGRVVRAIRGTGLELETLATHPDSGHALIGLEVPGWKAVVDLALEASAHIPGIDMQAWDVAVTDQGPVLMEVNIGGDYNLPQLALRQGMLDDELIEFLARCARRRGQDKAWAKLGVASLTS